MGIVHKLAIVSFTSQGYLRSKTISPLELLTHSYICLDNDSEIAQTCQVQFSWKIAFFWKKGFISIYEMGFVIQA